MGTSDGSVLRRFSLVPSRLRWQFVLAVAPVVLVALVVFGLVSYRSAAAGLRQQAVQQLHALCMRSASDIERHFRTLEAGIVSAARNPSTLLALEQLRTAAADLDADPLTEPTRMRPQMESLKRFLETYYQKEINAKSLDLRSLLLPQRSAVWLQANYLARTTGPAATGAPQDATLYGRYHTVWNPLFQAMADQFDLDDVSLVDGGSGRLVYSARKQPDFQTSLVDGPYATSTVAVLFQQLQRAGTSAGYTVVDFAPYAPVHGTPSAFAGAPIVDDGRTVGQLIVRLSAEAMNRLLSADGHWSQSGLGETGELYIVGGADSLMRSEPRFPTAPDGGPQPTARQSYVLRQRVESQATAATNDVDGYEGEYIGYRGIPVLGSARRLAPANGIKWTLIAEMSTAEALRSLTQLRDRTLWLAGLLFLATLPLIVAIATLLAARIHSQQLREAAAASHLDADAYQRRLQTDLHPVVTAALAASGGDLSQRITIDGSTFGNLAQALNRLLRTTGALVSHVHNTSATLIESATQIQSAARQLSHEAVQHTAEIAGTGASFREMRSRLDALGAEAAEAARAAQATDTATAQSGDVVAHVMAGMETLQSSSRTLALKMKRLGERSMEISTVTAAIQDITAQANMLALNATIEASRAGEHGLGFKAVANDVRKLAARTEATVKDMAELVTTLHGEAADAATCIDQQSEQIERQSSVVADAGGALTRCREAVAQNAERLTALSVVTGQHMRAGDDLGGMMPGIADFIRRTHVLSEQAVHSSAALLSMLTELHTWAQTFRVRTGNDSATGPAAPTQVIELSPHEAVGNGRGVGA